MLARYGFRWILAIVMVAVNLCLLGVDLATEPKPQPTSSHTNQRQAASPDGDTVTFALPPEPKVNVVFDVALMMNLPATYAGTILAILFPHSGQAMDIGLSTIFVFPLWYRIGRWIDRQRTPGGPSTFGPWRRTLRGFGWILAGFMIPAIIYSMPRAFRYKQWNIFPLLAWSLWCAFYLACSFWGGWREKKRLAAVSLQPTP